MILTFKPSSLPFHCKAPFTCTSHGPIHGPMPFCTRPRNYHLRSWSISPILRQKISPGFRSLLFSTSCSSKEEIESSNDQCVDSLKEKNRMSTSIAKSLFVAFFCISIGLFPPQKLIFRAMALPSAAAEVRSEEHEVKEENSLEFCWSDKEYENCTRRLMETASVLISKVESKPEKITDVDRALNEVAIQKAQLEDEIMKGISADVKLLKSKKHDLSKRSRNLLPSLCIMRLVCKILQVKARIFYPSVKSSSRLREVEDNIFLYEKEIEEIRQKVGEMDDLIMMKERTAIDVGVKELNFIWKQCEELVEELAHKIWSTKFERISTTIPQRQTKLDIQKELEVAQTKYWQQVLLPHILKEDSFDSSEDLDLYAINSLKNRWKHGKKLEDQIRTDAEQFKSEIKLVNGSSEIVSDYPHIALKRLFADKEDVDSKVTNIHVGSGLEKQCEVQKAGHNNNSLNTDDRKSVTERVDSLTMDRDIVVQKTWYNEKSRRWEMNLVTFSYAVSKNLIKKARIRRDWGAMYATIKGDDIEYFVNPKEFDFQLEEFGGFKGLYSRMIDCQIPITIEYIRVPWSDLNLVDRFILGVEFLEKLVKMWWRAKITLFLKDWTYHKVKNLSDDWLMTIVFPLIDLVIPLPMRTQLGMACPEGIEKSAASTWYLRWQSEIETSYMSRKTDDTKWLMKFTVRSIVFISVFLYSIKLITKVPETIFGSDEKRNTEFLTTILKLKIKLLEETINDGKDPIKNVFDKMKRIKNPPIKLKDFASIEPIRDEINEVVTFLRKPSAFQEIGARPPRGVLIVGESGTGKTSLALAIAAEAKVPLVEVKAKQLEAGNWVGQGASNIRELFQTARDLAPVIIFVEDFDNFAGVRGKYIHTKMQDHEAFINQLLVELDGFQKQEGVLLMATTNSLSNIDEALKRPGRMDRVFHLQTLTVDEREKILLMAAAENLDPILVDFVDWKKVAQSTDYLLPIHLKQVPASIEINAVREKCYDPNELLSHAIWVSFLCCCLPSWMLKTTVARTFKRMIFAYLGLTLTKEDIEKVVNGMQSSALKIPEIEIVDRPVDWSKATKFPHAVWASGRGLVALLLPDFDKVESIWIEPKHWQGMGCTKITRARNETSTRANFDTKLYLEKKLVFYFGSYVASQLLICSEDQNTLCLSELKQAEELATKMVIQFGWGSDYSPTVYSHVVETQSKPHVPLNGDHNVVSSVSIENESGFDTETGKAQEVPALSMGGEYRDEIASRIHKLYNLAFEKAEKMLKNNQKLLMETVESLIEFDVLMGEDLERLIKMHHGIREDPFSLTGIQNIEPVFCNYIEGDRMGVQNL